MKIVIDIPERDYDLACKYPNALIATYAHYIKDGKPYEERPQGDLISRETLKKAVENLVAGGEERLKDYYENGSKSEENEWIGGVYDAWELINNAPTVEPKLSDEQIEKIETYKNAYRIMSDAFENEVRKNKRPQGEWIDGYCNKCGGSSLCDGWGRDVKSKFCPNCGACMIKETDNEENSL